MAFENRVLVTINPGEYWIEGNIGSKIDGFLGFSQDEYEPLNGKTPMIGIYTDWMEKKMNNMRREKALCGTRLDGGLCIPDGPKTAYHRKWIGGMSGKINMRSYLGVTHGMGM
jgi:hypothetical protein